MLTICLATLWRGSLSDHTLLLEIEIPALLIALFVCQGECEDRICVLDGIVTFGGIGLQGSVDRVEGNGRSEGGYAGAKLVKGRDKPSRSKAGRKWQGTRLGSHTILKRHCVLARLGWFIRDGFL